MEIFSSYSGSEFLLFYALLLATCIAAGLWIPAVLRPDGKRGKAKGLEEIAVLTGGAERLTTALLSSLFAKGALREGGKGKLNVRRRDDAESEAESVVLAKVGDFSPAQARDSLTAEVRQIEAQLIERGLVMDGAERLRLRAISALPFAVLFLLGIYRQQAGDALGEPTGILTILLIATVLAGLIRFATVNKRTRAGQSVIKTLEGQSSRLKRAPHESEAGFAVALFGTAVLVGTPWEPVHAMRTGASSGDGGYGGDSDSDGGSGCGGGGCGGCGG